MSIEIVIIILKLVNAYIIDGTFKSESDIDIEIYDNYELMIDDFKKEIINGFFIVSHPKNEMLLNLTKNTEVRLLHLQKRPQDKTNDEEEEDKFFELNNLNENQEENKFRESRLDDITNAALIEPDIKDNFNIVINKIFQSIEPRSINLNSFYKTGNTYSYVETYSLKMVLVMNNNINPKYGKMFIDNYFNNIDNIKNDINSNYYKVDIDNYNIIDFDYKDSISFYKHDLSLHKLAKQKYIELGFIKKVINKKVNGYNN